MNPTPLEQIIIDALNANENSSPEEFASIIIFELQDAGYLEKEREEDYHWTISKY